MTIKIDIPDDIICKIQARFGEINNSDLNNTIKSIITARANTVYLCNGQYKYIINKQELLTIGKVHIPIKLSKMEKKIIHFLATTSKSFVKTEEVLKEVWKNEESTGSKESLRNFIKKIRTKTTKDFVINHFNQGYSLDISTDFLL